MTEPVISPLYTENSDFSTYLDALDLNPKELNSPHSNDNRFWSTNERFASDTSSEVFELTFSSLQFINYVTFDLARFPQTARLEYLNDNSEWLPLRDAVNQIPLTFSIGNSYPAVLTGGLSSNNLHPQHGYEGHWKNFEVNFSTVSTLKIRVVLQRIDNENVPRTGLGTKLAYSLAVRNFDVGYLIKNQKDVPLTAKTTQNSPAGAFTSNTDLLNSTVGYVYRENRADDIREEIAIWRSEPQPFPEAVVNFYADIRDEQGMAQYVDRITLAPISSNCHLSLYYSNDTAAYDFESPTDPLSSNIISVNGFWSSTDPLVFTQSCSIDIDTNTLGLVPNDDWWIGITITPLVSPNSLAGDRVVLFSLGGIEVNLTAGKVNVVSATGDNLSTTIDWYRRQPISIALGYGNGQYSLTAQSVAMTNGATLPSTVSLPTVPTGPLTVGKVRSGSADQFVLSAFVVKQELITDDVVSQISEYSKVPVFKDNELDFSKYNSLVRYDPSNQGNGYLNFYGGSINRYESMVWNPINRDYLLKQGDIKLPLTKAKFWKFEITNLQPQYFDIYQPVTREVLTFPSSVVNQYIGQQVERFNAREVGIEQSKSYNGSDRYVDSPLYVGTGTPTNGYSSTAVYVANDSNTADRLTSQLGNSWNYRNWHTTNTAPSWTSAGRHNYDKKLIEHTETVAYFAALGSVTFNRRNYLSAYSYEVYDQILIDTTAYDPGNWVNAGDYINSGNSNYAQAVSQLYPTLDNIRGLQFAAQQTDAVQLIPNDDFSIPDTSNWVGYGDGYITPGSADTKTITVSRNVQVGYWASVALKYPDIWNRNDITFGMLSSGGNVGMAEGGIESANPIPAPEGGSLYAAARIFTTTPLSSPLYVQIIDADNKTLISEQSATISQNKVGEWYARWDISLDSKPTTNLYNDLPSTWGNLKNHSWGDWEDHTPPSTSKILVRLVQKNPSSDTWKVDRLSLYYSPILWEFSRDGGDHWYHATDIRNNPYGVLLFPEDGSSNIKNQLMWKVTSFKSGIDVSALTIRPWYTTKVGVGSFAKGAQVPDGPNLVNYDNNQGSLNDPRFKVWHNPVPRDWWFAFQNAFSTTKNVTVKTTDAALDIQTANAILIGR